MKIKNPEWKVADTAKYFGVSNGLACENMKLSKLSRDKPEIFECKNRDNALKKAGMLK